VDTYRNDLSLDYSYDIIFWILLENHSLSTKNTNSPYLSVSYVSCLRLRYDLCTKILQFSHHNIHISDHSLRNVIKLYLWFSFYTLVAFLK